MFDFQEIGLRLKDARKSSEHTLEEAGAKVGVSRSTILRWENGETKEIKIPMLKELAEFYNVNYRWLVGWSENKHPDTFTNASPQSNVFPTTDAVIKLPALGKISAGLPILAVENIEDYIPAPSSLLKRDHEYFYLRVVGDSMNKKFPEGSFVLVQKQPVLEPDEIGVFRINGDDATVKQFKGEINGNIILMPMSYNEAHKKQEYNLTKIPVEIIGKVISYTGTV